MPEARVEISMSDYQTMLTAKGDLEREIVRLKTVNTLEVARVVDANLSQAVGHAVAITKFAMSRLGPEATHGWPRKDLAEFVRLLADRPHDALWQAIDELSWVADARDFAAEAASWDERRDRHRLQPPPPSAIAYLAHPVGRGPEREANLQRALRWVRYLVDTQEHAICAPWLPYCLLLDEDTYRQRGVRDGVAMLRKCDLLYAVGGQISPGMRSEIDVMMALGRPVVDLTYLGPEPPESGVSSDSD